MRHHSAPFTIVALSGLMCSMVHAQEPVWIKQYGNSNANLGLKLAHDGQGVLYGVGRAAASALELDDTTVTVLGLQDILLAKWDTSGAVLWARTAGGYCPPGSDSDGGGLIVHDGLSGRVVIGGTFSCSQTSFGNIILSGSQNNTNQFVAGYDYSGECQWARSATGYDIRFMELLTDNASNVFVFGSALTAGISFPNIPPINLPVGGFIARYASDGTLLDAQRVLVNGELLSADWTGADAWVLTGAARPNASLYGEPMAVHSAQYDGFVARVDTTGAVEWTKTFPSNGFSRILHGAALPNGRTLICGYFREDLMMPADTLEGPVDQHTFFLSTLDASGVPEWTVPIRGTEYVSVNDVKVGPDGDIFLYGRYNGDLALGADTLAPYASRSGFVARFSATGECKAAWGFGRTYYASGSILPTDHGLYLSTEFDSTLVMGSYTVHGTHTGPDQGYHDLLIARFDSLSGFTGIIAPKASQHDRLHIYANPNNGVCTIELPATVKPGSALVLTIHDAMGRVVQQVPLRWSEGTIQLDIRAQARGIYHAELIDGKQRYSGTIVFE